MCAETRELIMQGGGFSKIYRYVKLVQYICGYRKPGKNLAEAVDPAIDQCIKEIMLKEYLLKKKSKEKRMLLTEFAEPYRIPQ